MNRFSASKLVVISGPDAGRSLPLDVPIVVVGSGNSAQLRLTDDAVAAEHIELSIVDEGVHLRDRGNGGGTRLAGMSIRDVVFTSSTEFMIGNTVLRLDMDEVSDSLPPPPSSAVDVATPSYYDLAHLPYREARARAIARFERAYLPMVLAQTGNVVVRAARHAGVGRGSFHRMLGRIRDTAKAS